MPLFCETETPTLLLEIRSRSEFKTILPFLKAVKLVGSKTLRFVVLSSFSLAEILPYFLVFHHNSYKV